jgi:outer membrane biosynthesis protein TonB
MDRAEKLGLGAATAGHVVLFGLLSVGFLATPNPLKIERPPIEVQFVDEVGLEAATPRPSREPPATSVAPELGAPDPAPPPLAQSQPEPRPVLPDPAPVPAPTPKPQKPPVRQSEAKASSKASRDSAPRTAPKGSRLGPDFLKGISDKASASRAAAINAPIGARERASLAAELLRQLRPHWRSPSGADIEQLRVVVVARLNKDGSLAGEPRAENVTGVTASNRAQARLFAERAVAAVKLGAPYDLPVQFYEAWRVIRPRFKKDL